MFLDNWNNSRCWDVPLPESEADCETVASGVPRPRLAASDERLPSRPSNQPA